MPVISGTRPKRGEIAAGLYMPRMPRLVRLLGSQAGKGRSGGAKSPGQARRWCCTCACWEVLHQLDRSPDLFPVSNLFPRDTKQMDRPGKCCLANLPALLAIGCHGRLSREH